MDTQQGSGMMVLPIEGSCRYNHIIKYIYIYIYLNVTFHIPLQLKGTCLPQKKCFALDLVYYMVGIA